jgi:hypothetical protein
MNVKNLLLITSITLVMVLGSASVFADPGSKLCDALPSHSALETALVGATHAAGGPSNGGFDLHMWGTIVANDGTVCAVAMTGSGLNDQWLGSRIISAQKANTANAFSLDSGGGIPGLALSTANLFSAVQPGGSLFGLQFSNPVDPKVAYKGDSKKFGTDKDPLNGKKIGGVNVFGGGLALYDSFGNMIGALGVSGDSSCADHNVAWRTRDALELDNVVAGVGVPGDNIIYDISINVDGNPESAGGFGHPTCLGTEDTVNAQIIIDHPLGPNP